MRLPLTLMIVLASFATTTATLAETPNEAFREARALVSPDAIDEQGFVSIGGIQQWISVRGRHRSAPVLLVLHGGPAFTLSPVSYYYMRDWEEHFTVVHWDQRGAGKTYAANPPDEVAPTLTVDRMVADAEELIDYLRRKYAKERIVLFGHSFGTILGVKLAQKRPEWLHAYVGMGQFTDFQLSEAEGYAATLAAAKADGNAKAVAELSAIAPFPDLERPERNLENLGVERTWLATYGGYYWRGKFGHTARIAAMSPDFTAQELKIRDEAQGFSNRLLWKELGSVSFMDVTRFKVPVVILQGRHDLGTSSRLAAQWFEKIEAPKKQIIWFEDSAHMVYEEEPGKTLASLVNSVSPLAVER